MPEALLTRLLFSMAGSMTSMGESCKRWFCISCGQFFSFCRYKIVLPHFLNWLKSSGCRVHLDRVRGAILEWRNPQEAVGISETPEDDANDDDWDDEQSGSARKVAKRAADKPDSIAAAASSAPARPGAPTTLKVPSGGESVTAAAAGEEQDEEGGRGAGKRKKKRKETSDTE